MIDGKVHRASRRDVAEQDGDDQNECRYERAKEKFGADRCAEGGPLSQRRTYVGIDVRPGGDETPDSPIRIQICPYQDCETRFATPALRLMGLILGQMGGLRQRFLLSANHCLWARDLQISGAASSFTARA